jgi:hypothetical protein
MLSNPNIIGPLGTQTVTYGNEVFDEAAYNRAMETYQSRGGRGEMPTEAQFTVQNQETGAYGLDQPGYMRALAQWAAAGGAAPTREQFTTRTNLDIPTVRQTLTPEAQATLEAQQRVDRQLAQLGERFPLHLHQIFRQFGRILDCMAMLRALPTSPAWAWRAADQPRRRCRLASVTPEKSWARRI